MPPTMPRIAPPPKPVRGSSPFACCRPAGSVGCLLMASFFSPPPSVAADERGMPAPWTFLGTIPLSSATGYRSYS